MKKVRIYLLAAPSAPIPILAIDLLLQKPAPDIGHRAGFDFLGKIPNQPEPLDPLRWKPVPSYPVPHVASESERLSAATASLPASSRAANLRSHRSLLYSRLKCDRVEPCSNCVSRGVECTYASAARGRGSAGGGVASRRRDRDGNQQLDARLRHLEQLINQMGAQSAQTSQTSQTSHNGSTSSRDASVSVCSNHPPNVGTSPSTSISEIEPGRLMANNDQFTYVSASHWAAISNEVWVVILDSCPEAAFD